MKVLVVSPYVGTTYGGTSKVVLDLAQSLAVQDLEIDVITTVANGSTRLSKARDCWIEQDGYRIRYFSCVHHNDFILSSGLLWWLHRHVSEYALVHTHTVFSPIIMAVQRICRYHKRPYIVTPHGMLEPWALAYKATKKSLFFKLFERQSLEKSATVHALNSIEAENIKRLGITAPMAIVANGIHRREFAERTAPTTFYEQFPETQGKTLILFLGRIDPKKGLDLLAPAFGQIHQKYPNTHLVVAGPDSIGYMSTAKSYFEQSNCIAHVTFTGMLKGQLKQAALSAANIYIAPYYSEGFSMSILEGMASALPTIMTTGCNFPEAARAGIAYEVQPSSEELALALEQCLANLSQSEGIAQRARAFIFDNYTWDKIAIRLVDVYHSIIEDEPHSDLFQAKTAQPTNAIN